ncbi:MAG: hypothetical protein NVSMB14_06170 [Isosphaeraceae bacterium]
MKRFGWIVLGMGVFSVAGAWAWPRLMQPGKPRLDPATLSKTTVRRVSVDGTILASGRLETSRETRVECKLERIGMSLTGKGQTQASGIASTIIELLPQGARVHKGDVVCRLDSSDFEEMVRQQLIKVQTGRAATQQAKLDLETAEMALWEYQKGLVRQREEELQSEIAMAESQLRRARDQVEFRKGMVVKGYAPELQLLDAKITLMTSEMDLARFNQDLQFFHRWEIPDTVRSFGVDVAMAKSEYDYQTRLSEQQERQLKRFETQVRNCVVRAPHDGIVIYATKKDGTPFMEEGALIRQKQLLFRLPDLSKMEVLAALNETIVNRVEKGMAATVKLEALGSIDPLPAHVGTISPIPLLSSHPGANNDVKNYTARILLERVPDGLLPGMSAEVRILSTARHDALVVPNGAILYDEGHEYCYVADADSVERRSIEVGRSTPEYLEVTEGLKEGEQIVLDPSLVDPSQVDQSPASPPSRETVADTPVAIATH